MSEKTKETVTSKYVKKACDLGGFTIDLFAGIARRSLENQWSFEEQAKSELVLSNESLLCGFMICARLLNFIDDDGSITMLSVMVMTCESTNKQCKHCKKEVTANSKYCHACGAQFIL